MNKEEQENFKKELQSVEQLYPNLAVLSKLTGMLKHMNIDQSDLATLIKTDSSLTMDIIRISNSAFYGGGQTCSDINTALLKIGQNRVLEVVSICISRNVFNQDLSRYGISANDYWAKSLATGLLMETMAKQLGADSDKAYTVGILHSVGMIIINRIMDTLGIELYWDSSISQTEWEEQITGYNYAIAGAEILERWKFPREFSDIVRYQAIPDQSPDPTLLLKILNFAINLINHTGWQLQFREDLELCTQCQEFLLEKQFGTDDLNSLLVQTHDQMKRIIREF